MLEPFILQNLFQGLINLTFHSRISAQICPILKPFNNFNFNLVYPNLTDSAVIKVS
jgi:hypothetical protein